MPRTVRSIEGDTVDLIAWRERGTEPGLVEAIVEANRGLAGAGAILPIGTAVTIPDSAPVPARTTIRLWD